MPTSLLDYVNKVDDLETNLYVVAGVLGGVCGVLSLAVMILSVAVATAFSKCNALERSPMQKPMQNDNNSQTRPTLGRHQSMYNERGTSYPQSQAKPYQLTAENLMNMELKNQLHNRNRDADWDNDVRSAPGGVKRNSIFYNQRGGIHSDSGDRPFPLYHRPGNPGNFSSNMQNVGY